MPVIQEAFYIPPDIATGLATGLYRRMGGVVRYAVGSRKGQIVKHLDPVNIPVAQEATGILAKAATFAKNNKKAMIVVGAAVAVAGGSAYAYHKVKTYEPAVVSGFRKALSQYVDAIRTGTMEEEKIDMLIKALERMKADKNFDKFTIKLTAEDIDVLVNRIYSYTLKLAHDNEYQIESDDLEGEENPIISLEKFLEVQKRIFAAA